MTPMNDTDREAFEAEAEAVGFDMTKVLGGEYASVVTDDARRPWDRAIAHARQPGEPVAKKPFVGWYCPHCQRGVDSREVTFSEQHEVCGTYIGDAEPPASWEETVQYAERLAASLHAKHFPENASWRPLSGDLIGLLTQIDNMTADLVRSAPPALPAPVAVPDGDRAKMAANLVSIADASRRADGSDIPLGETLRKAAAMLAAAPAPPAADSGESGDLEEAVRLAEVGEYLFNACRYSGGDGYTEPREMGIDWQWQQTAPEQYGEGMLLAAATKWHDDRAEDDIITEARKLRSALASRDKEIERLTAEVQSEVDAAIRQISTLTRLRYDAEALAAKAIRERDEALKRNVELQVLAHGWMVAHDMLKAGKPYQFPRPADLPDAIRERDEARAECERLKGLLWYAWYEFNSIKARHGAPVDSYLMLTCDPDWWEQMTNAFAAAIGPDDTMPWPSVRARAALHPEGAKDGQS